MPSLFSSITANEVSSPTYRFSQGTRDDSIQTLASMYLGVIASDAKQKSPAIRGASNFSFEWD